MDLLILSKMCFNLITSYLFNEKQGFTMGIMYVFITYYARNRSSADDFENNKAKDVTIFINNSLIYEMVLNSLWQTDNMLIKNNAFFSNTIFKCRLLQIRQDTSVFWKGCIHATQHFRNDYKHTRLQDNAILCNAKTTSFA